MTLPSLTTIGRTSLLAIGWFAFFLLFFPILITGVVCMALLWIALLPFRGEITIGDFIRFPTNHDEKME